MLVLPVQGVSEKDVAEAIDKNDLDLGLIICELQNTPVANNLTEIGMLNTLGRIEAYRDELLCSLRGMRNRTRRGI